MEIVLPSDEPVEIRTIKNIESIEPEKTLDDQDSDDEILKKFHVVLQPMNEFSSCASSVCFSYVTSLATSYSHALLHSVQKYRRR
jgi:hypothetical protein